MSNESQTGIIIHGDATVAGLLALIPDPDGTGPYQPATAGNLDEMFPSTASALRKELLAIQTAQGGSGQTLLASGVYTITSGDATANLANITTGLADFTLANASVSVWNGVTLATSDAVITKQAGGVLRVADGSTYNTVAGYKVRWAVFSA